MKYLVLSDVHANVEALEAVLNDCGSFDGVLFLGDLVGYGPNPDECVACLRDLPNVTALIGNHDLAALGRLDLSAFNHQARAAAMWTAARMSDGTREYLRRLSTTAEVGAYLLAHGSPRDPVWEYLETVDQAAASFSVFAGDLCFVGHTHVPRVFTRDAGEETHAVRELPACGTLSLTVGSRFIINPGGVGQPRDGDPRAAYAEWDTVGGAIEFRRVPYPIEATQTKILDAGLPPPLAYRLSAGL